VIRILITGFEPYGNFERNPSAEVALALGKNTFSNCELDSLILPVSFRRTFEILRGHLEKSERPDVIISTGLMPFASSIQLERVAINMKDYDGIPDNEGATPQDEYIIPGGPTGYFSTLPIRRIADALSKVGISAVISNTAGTHLCNFVMYNVLHYVGQQGWKTRAGFVHLPFLPEHVQKLMHRPQNTPSLPFDVMVKAAEVIARTAADVISREV